LLGKLSVTAFLVPQVIMVTPWPRLGIKRDRQQDQDSDTNCLLECHRLLDGVLEGVSRYELGKYYLYEILSESKET
jgi:hypothetical protein